ncbi:MAG TPA: GntR family transcriptional regulator [Syntrophorhabdaceae bacterium]|nr:GntR family transcriptional regulator [Syntrophorhabdaceae bacterium]
MEKALPVPYYVQVAETIRSRILANHYGEGDLIPSYRQLEKEFNISNITVRKAVEILVQDGIINRKRGVGTEVSRVDGDAITWELSGNLQSLRNSAGKVSLAAEILEIATIACPERIGEILAIGPTQKVWRMKKIRRHEKTIMAYYITYSDPRWCTKVTKNEAKKGGFVDLFRKKSGLKLTRLEQRVEATVADLDLSAILEVNFGFPLLHIENVYYSSGNKPVLITQIYYRGDKNSYKATIPL